ncbi:MAG: GTP 3',8-cyclase MoaA [Thermovirgaceae bacterium]
MDKLTDRYGRTLTYLRISVTDRCNFRCRYCMPAEGVPWIPHEKIMTFEDIEFLAASLMPMGIRKIRFTGGEPFVRKGFVQFLKDIKSRHTDLRITATTNGSMLARFSSDLGESGISGINVSLDTLDPGKFRFITRTDAFEDVMEGIKVFSETTTIPLKINTVLINGFNDDEIENLIRFAQKHRAVLRFIEFMPLDGDVWAEDRFISADTIFKKLPGGRKAWMELPANSAHNFDGPAAYYRNPNTGQRIGIIAAVSHHFCDRCNRLRITATGEMRTCLFSGEGTQLLPFLRERDAEALKRAVKEAAFKKPKSWTATRNTERHMSRIGG